jgi:UDP:flavonoid glycosyltransferase YjiC (YdhE family)
VSKIILNTFGSFGDLHPYLAIAIELKRRGHESVVATSEVYRKKVEAEGVSFAAVRPDIGELMNQPGFLKMLWDRKDGTKSLIRDYLLPSVSQSYEDLAKACEGADLLLTHFAAYAGPIVAEVQKLRWMSIALQPTIFFSKYDPPVLAPAAWARHLYDLGPWVFAAMMKVGALETARWIQPLTELRARVGLPPTANPLIHGQFSPFGTLALFSEQFAKPQPDWPAKTITTGFVSYDKAGEGFGLSPNQSELEKFLAAGPAPVVFTLGSSAVMEAEQFFEESMEAAKKLGVRAILLAWKKNNLPASNDSLLITDYAPFSHLFPRASVVVHAGGVGTVGQALRAGRPMLVVPWAHDQPDNAERCCKLGVALTVQRNRYRAGIVARKLSTLLNDPIYGQKANAIAQSLATENGLKTACDAIEG